MKKILYGIAQKGWKKDFVKYRSGLYGSPKPMFTLIGIPDIIADKQFSSSEYPEQDIVSVKITIEEVKRERPLRKEKKNPGTEERDY